MGLLSIAERAPEQGPVVAFLAFQISRPLQAIPEDILIQCPTGARSRANTPPAPTPLQMRRAEATLRLPHRGPTRILLLGFQVPHIVRPVAHLADIAGSRVAPRGWALHRVPTRFQAAQDLLVAASTGALAVGRRAPAALAAVFTEAVLAVAVSMGAVVSAADTVVDTAEIRKRYS